jgi:hypothetical protein
LKIGADQRAEQADDREPFEEGKFLLGAGDNAFDALS